VNGTGSRKPSSQTRTCRREDKRAAAATCARREVVDGGKFADIVHSFPEILYLCSHFRARAGRNIILYRTRGRARRLFAEFSTFRAQGTVRAIMTITRTTGKFYVVIRPTDGFYFPITSNGGLR